MANDSEKFTAEQLEQMAQTHPGFVIKCEKCGSEAVYIENTLGWSEESGSWGEVTIVCANCDRRVDIA